MGSLSAQHPDSASDPTWAWPAKDGPWAPVGRGSVRPSPPWAEPVSRGPSSSETILLGNQLSFLQSPSSPGDLILVSALPPGLCESFIGRLRKKSRRLCLTKAFVTCTAEPADPRRAAVLSAGQRGGLALLRCGSAPGPESVLSQRVLGCLGFRGPPDTQTHGATPHEQGCGVSPAARSLWYPGRTVVLWDPGSLCGSLVSTGNSTQFEGQWEEVGCWLPVPALGGWGWTEDPFRGAGTWGAHKWSVRGHAQS